MDGKRVKVGGRFYVILSTVAVGVACRNLHGWRLYELAHACVFAFVAVVQDNQMFQALFFSSLMASFLYLLRVIFKVVILPRITTLSSSITIHNSDPNFEAVIDYISVFVRAESAFSIQAKTKKKEKTSKDFMRKWLGTNKRDVDSFEFRPDSDKVIHSFYCEDNLIFMTRTLSSQPLMGGYMDVPFTPESLTLTVWGSNNAVLQKLLQDAVQAAVKQRTADSLYIYTQSDRAYLAGSWELATSKRARAKSSVILDNSYMESLLEDAQAFLGNSQWYAEKGIPYRRGYLLYGPPGCGKTSFVQVLAGELQLDISILNLTHEGMNDNILATYLRDAPLSSIIVLEDVDAIFVERGAATEEHFSKGKKRSSTVSFSGLLNALDGVASQEGRIFFMTTNHIEKLDPALIRPGRCDVKLEVKLATTAQVEGMFRRFFPDAPDSMLKRFSSQIPSNQLSMAALQGHFCRKDQSAQEAIDRVPLLLKTARTSTARDKSMFEHLKRVGLEHYAHVFESHGMNTALSLTRIPGTSGSAKVKDLIALSKNLQFDLPAQQRLEKLVVLSEGGELDKATQAFLVDSYALADASSLREAFIEAYKDCGYGYDATAADSDGDDDDESEEEEGDEEDEDGDDDDNTRNVALKPTLTKLVKSFCKILTDEDCKGRISLHELRHLLQCFPLRPQACVAFAGRHVAPQVRDKQEKKTNDKQARKTNAAATSASTSVAPVTDPASPVPLPIYPFLKRLGVAKQVHFFERDAASLDQLTCFLESLKAEEKRAKCQKQFRISAAQAMDLVEVMEQKVTHRAALWQFGLHSRAMIMDTFTAFYTDATLESKVTIDTYLRFPSSLPKQELDNLAFQYGVLATDALGRGLVSLLEIRDHLLQHKGDPGGAVGTAQQELVTPAYPSPLLPKAVPATPREFVYGWLKAGEGKDMEDHLRTLRQKAEESASENNDSEITGVDGKGTEEKEKKCSEEGKEDVAKEGEEGSGLEQYARFFIDQDLCWREDLAMEPVFTDSELKDTFNVGKVGHRRKIVRMQERLIAEAAKE